MNESMRAKLSSLGRRLEEIDAMLSSPEVGSDMNKFRDLSRERAEIEPVVQKVREYEKYEKQRAESEELLSDPDMKELAQAEFTECREKLEQLDKDLEIMLLPTDPNDKRNIFLEIRAGTGGDESALFAGDLLRMYMRYAERQGWKTEIVSKSESDLGGYKEVIVRVIGDGAYSKLKFESGGHRVQRVPATESQGRIHTSACTVAVLPELDEVEANAVTVETLFSENRYPYRRLPRVRRRRTARAEDGLRGPNHAPADWSCRGVPGRTKPASE